MAAVATPVADATAVVVAEVAVLPEDAVVAVVAVPEDPLVVFNGEIEVFRAPLRL